MAGGTLATLRTCLLKGLVRRGRCGVMMLLAAEKA
jgi:hypothetical protein